MDQRAYVREAVKLSRRSRARWTVEDWRVAMYTLKNMRCWGTTCHGGHRDRVIMTQKRKHSNINHGRFRCKGKSSPDVYDNYCTHKVERKLVRTFGVAVVDLGYSIMGEACGEGTYGTVFPALLRNGGKNAGGDLVVVKHVKIDSPELPVGEVEMREVQIFQKLSHPQVVKLISAQRTPYALDLIFEHCDSDLRAVMRQEKKANSQTRSYLTQLVSGVVYIHAQGVIHRDLKLANVLVKKVPHGMVLKIADFGMACEVLASGSMTPRRVYARCGTEHLSCCWAQHGTRQRLLSGPSGVFASN